MIKYEELNLKFRYFRFVELNQLRPSISKKYHVIFIEEAFFELKERHPKFPYIRVTKPIYYVPFRNQDEFISYKSNLSKKWSSLVKYTRDIKKLYCLQERIYKMYDSREEIEVLTQEEFNNEKTIDYYRKRKDQTIRKYKDINFIIRLKLRNLYKQL